MQNTIWILEETGNEKFPYRLTIRQDERILLRLWVQEKWPGQKGNIFCIREEEDTQLYPEAEIERVPVVSLKRYGKRLAVILDRPKNKRCDFLFLTKSYKTKEGQYEQIFWRTERGLRERKLKVKLSTYTQSALAVAVDSGERYAWSFPGDTVSKERLPAGDYALKGANGISALVERKTFDNLLHEFGRMPIFHQQLTELESYRHAALVIEANYSDFLNPDKMRHYPLSFASKAIAELHAAPHEKIAEVISTYGEPPEAAGGSFYEMKRVIENDFPPEFTVAMIRESFPNVPEATIQRVLRNLKKEDLIIPHGRGKKSWWRKIEETAQK